MDIYIYILETRHEEPMLPQRCRMFDAGSIDRPSDRPIDIFFCQSCRCAQPDRVRQMLSFRCENRHGNRSKSGPERACREPQIDPKSLPGPSRDASGAPKAPPSLQDHLPDAPGERKERPKEPPRSPWGVPRSLPATSGSAPEPKKRAPAAFLHQKSSPSVFRSLFHRFLVVF